MIRIIPGKDLEEGIIFCVLIIVKYNTIICFKLNRIKLFLSLGKAAKLATKNCIDNKIYTPQCILTRKSHGL